MKHVCMVVWNEFLHDARVTKEAESLLMMRCRVSVVAVHTPNKNLKRENLPSGIEVQRVSRQVPLVNKVKQGFMFGAKGGRIRRGVDPERTQEKPGGLPLSSSSQRTVARRILSGLGRLAGYWRMLGVAYKSNADVYHAHDANVLVVVALAAILRRKPLVYDAHEISTDREGYHAIRFLIWLSERLFARKARLMITTTDMRADYFVKAYNVERPLVLQNRPRFIEVTKNDYLREYFSLSSNRPIILYQGGVQRGRGLHNIVKVAERLPQYAFVFVGQGAQLPDIQAEVELRQLRDTVYFHPMVPLEKLPGVTASADVGLQVIRNTCLNHYTTDSNKLFEYVMAGLPVVASDFPEIRKIVNQYDLGRLVDPESIDEITEAIKDIVETPGEIARLTRNAASARHSLSWESQESSFTEAYSNVF